ncbi:MAG: dihydrodipicolinate synthase family protein [Litorimonas sp.]
MSIKKDSNWGGIFCYFLTPFKENGDVNYDIIKPYVDAVIDSGVDGITCVASTTEGDYLTEQERFKVVEEVCRAADNRVEVSAGVGARGTRQSIEYALQAQAAGAKRVIMEMQTYFPLGFENVFQHYEQVGDAIKIPIRLYNIPTPTKYDITADQVLQLSTIERIDSVKDASGDPKRIQEIVRLCDADFKVYCGFHWMAPDVFAFGAKGWECAMHPSYAKGCVDLYQALSVKADPKEAAEIYARHQKLFLMFKYFGVPQTVRALSNTTDIDLGAPRSPLLPLGAANYPALKQAMALCRA